MTPEQIAAAIVINASNTGNFSGYVSMDAGVLRRLIAEAIQAAFEAGARNRQ